MKKLLLASTALIGFAGFAAAEVVIEGSAEMGITGGDLKETQFHNSYNLNFKMSGETDTGLSFGATYRLDADGSSEENQNPVGDNGTVFISGAFGKLTLGDTDGAADWAMQETAMGTSITDEGTTHVGYSGNSLGDGRHDDQVLRYEYAFGDFGVALSVEHDDGNTDDGDDFDPIIGLGGKYKTEFSGVTLGFGLGYQTGEGSVNQLTPIIEGAFDLDRDEVEDALSDTANEFLQATFGSGKQGFDAYGLSVSAGMDNGFSAVLNYSVVDFDDAYDITYYGVGFGYEMGALLLHMNYGVEEYDFGNEFLGFDVDMEDRFDSFGLIANYDLGGGAILAAGYASDVSYRDGDQEQFSLGMSLSF
ncbi:porin [Frigidibacter albus]|uniref:Porin n=1 Tax=Frigidibacter albus TaxID=1465486 RepID=A0A6L8VLL9_9RHOB|nr:porin [Frigidibacter albus]MZQ90432.1 porin [Frigidibacter albus]NBE32448.1 porin [Frigidibacter albus]GGH59801.1 porin [Frigidibacter albus]